MESKRRLAAAPLVLFVASVRAQGCPAQPIKLIVPWPPGGRAGGNVGTEITR